MDVSYKFPDDYSPHEFILIQLLIFQVLLLIATPFLNFNLIGAYIAYSLQSSKIKL